MQHTHDSHFATTFATYPGLLAWIVQLGHTPEEVQDIRVSLETRIKTQEEVQWNGYREHAHTGLVYITVTFLSGEKHSKTFTKAELEDAATNAQRDNT